MIISLLQEKGGSGKTTISINLAAEFKRRGYSVLLVDSDPQGSARDWHAANDGSLLDVIGLDRPTIDKDIWKVAPAYDYTFIDGAPHLSTMVTKTILCSDVILIPVQPSPYDVWASKSLVDLVKQRQDITNGKLKAAFLVSRQIPQTTIGKEVRDVLNEYGLPVFRSGTFQRVTYATTAAEGCTVHIGGSVPAVTEVQYIAKELLAFMGVQNGDTQNEKE
jgi:chromosome partitioning protein